MAVDVDKTCNEADSEVSEVCSEVECSPTERVRTMLDEQGVEYNTLLGPSPETVTYFDLPDGREVGYTDFGDGHTQLRVWNATPEQAIAATMGNSTDLSKRLREVHGLHEFAELFGFDWTGESDWDWHDVACAMADAVDVATVGRSCASCPEMDNPDSYIVHLHRVLEVADEGVGTCHMRLAYEEEDADGFIWPDHYECDACGAKVNGIMPFYDTEIPPKYCPNCRARVIKED